MPAYLITGRGGSGKTAVGKALHSRGFSALDADDVPGLAKWIDLATGQPTEVDSSKFVDYSKIGWNWQAPVLAKLLTTHRLLFLCGSASNELEFHHRFDRVFVLTLPPEVQEARLLTRDSPYGKDPDMRRVILAEQQRFVPEAEQLGAIAINSNRPLAAVVDDILSYVPHAR